MSLADVIQSQHDAIIRLWTERAERAASANGLSHPELQKLIPAYLSSLAGLDAPGRAPSAWRIEDQLGARLRKDFLLPVILEEVLQLGASIADVYRSSTGHEPPFAEIQLVIAELQRAATSVSQLYVQHLLEEEQEEKKFLRRIQDVATEARGLADDETPSLRTRLPDVLSVVLEAVAADGGVIVLEEGAPVVAAGAGVLADPLTPEPDDPASFVKQVAASAEGSISVEDVGGSHWSFNRSVHDSGSHAVAGVRLPTHGPLVGVLYVARATEPFSSRERRRFAAVADLLSVLLDNARLYAALRNKIREYEAERLLRERFVSVLAHDLRSPLSVARIGAALLLRVPESLDERRDIAARIVTGIDRTDRMVRDLLDANRIRAGKPLTLKLAPCNLFDAVRDAVMELVAEFGDVFRVEGDESVAGVWSEQDLRRVAANLGSNAAKYGSHGADVLFSVARSERGARLLVRNEGNPLTPEEVAHIFQPFSRTASAEAGGSRGWGLGLTLVKGSVEAHGGTIRVESAPGQGTTFVVDLPLDSRPFQPAEPDGSSSRA
jgi:signal transduction histidine kinase